ncbi:MAG: rhodanese-like domain-containing protein [Nanoarchaeota archaeon]|nr:rhodanese-like domain-containing protein [Nanoarchaeota archaeon]
MTKRNFIIGPILLLLLGILLMTSCTTNDKSISPTEAVALIEENTDNENFVILDVRTNEEFTSGHIDGAINLDYYSETFSDDVSELDKDKNYLIYCRSGKRSQASFDIMEGLGFKNLYNMEGGIEAYQQDYEIVTE